MARYIDAEALKERLLAISVVSDDWYGMGINRGLDRAETAIDMMPTADVARKIFEEIDAILCYHGITIGLAFDEYNGADVAIGRVKKMIAELEKKYVEDE